MAQIATFVAALTGRTTFEDAAEDTLARVLATCAAAVETGPFAGAGKVLRAMVHLRPGGSYRGLVVLEERAGRPRTGTHAPRDTAPPILPSVTAWRWVSRHCVPVSIDVTLGTVELLPDRAPASPSLAAQSPAAGITGSPPPAVVRASPSPARASLADSARFESRGLLLGRDATHVLAVPFGRGPGAVDGMISVEASCRGPRSAVASSGTPAPPTSASSPTSPPRTSPRSPRSRPRTRARQSRTCQSPAPPWAGSCA
ncbi:MAG: hypothetical protein R3F14_41965 [Polyangiaceae bacterium]